MALFLIWERALAFSSVSALHSRERKERGHPFSLENPIPEIDLGSGSVSATKI